MKSNTNDEHSTEWTICPNCKAEFDTTEIMSMRFEQGYAKALDDVEKKKIIKNEFCSCGHSKDCHTPHSLDLHGGECNQCKCDIYTWNKFEYVELSEEIAKLKEKT